ncbi:MAG: hypothetical protein PHS21_09655, partial [Atribacterota bacterium]|nr:hypothetical protein [Atribacterota bacterium]
MNNNYKQGILAFQSDYLKIISKFKLNNITLEELSIFIDEITTFWLSNITSIEYYLENVIDSKYKILYTGGVYLSDKGYDHYYFKSLGDMHIIPDPLMKIENLLRAPKEDINRDKFIAYFKRTLLATKNILNRYPNKFNILPVFEILEKNKIQWDYNSTDRYLSFLSSIFNDEIKDREYFNRTYKSYNEIQKAISPIILKKIIFTDNKDSNLDICDRIDRFIKINNTHNIYHGSEQEIFYLVLFSIFCQI